MTTTMTRGIKILFMMFTVPCYSGRCQIVLYASPELCMIAHYACIQTGSCDSGSLPEAAAGTVIGRTMQGAAVVTEVYDIVVIGAGIHGAGVAQAAAASGHTVLLIEQTGIAAGTSSRSSKLIHGGLRYLESMQYRLVRESLRERQLLLKLAPDLVRRVPFYIPVYATTRRRPWQIHAGLSLYALLGGLGADNLFRRIPLHDWNNPDGIETRGLQAVFRYFDAQTDDAALTRAVVRSAVTLGARLLLPASFISAAVRPDHVVVRYHHNNTDQECQAAVLVNAAGPWVNQVLEAITPSLSRPSIELVRGTHIRVAGTSAAGNWYMEAPQDGRAVFAMPREGSLLVGTTEAVYTGDPAAVVPVAEDQRYLLEVLAHYFPYYRDSARSEVLSAYAGVRVLPKGTGAAFNRPRETIMATDRDITPRVLSIYGGKLTTWRATAAKVMRRIGGGLPVRSVHADTRTLLLAPD